jgi:hypothetical protein
MRNAVAFANNDVITIAWSYGAKPDGCMGFALYRIDTNIFVEKIMAWPSITAIRIAIYLLTGVR